MNDRSSWALAVLELLAIDVGNFYLVAVMGDPNMCRVFISAGIRSLDRVWLILDYRPLALHQSVSNRIMNALIIGYRDLKIGCHHRRSLGAARDD